MQSTEVDHSLTASQERTRSLQQSISPYRAMENLQHALEHGAPPSPQPRVFADALQRCLETVERRQAWMIFRRVLVRCASALVIEGD